MNDALSMIRVVYEVFHRMRKYFCTAKFIFSMKIISQKNSYPKRKQITVQKPRNLQVSADRIYYFLVFCEKNFHYGESVLQICICDLNLRRTHKL